ncbi:hypothetical protein BCV70DRAFT_46733 [Testicularia cyperi]|uniref:Uncharacterized protein n=1 Tax=Testicularia cyperi TaxID=1882483 RepID=A0A317XJ91_9BASI|nr:hypothetical protein BCV70DRAFT_46733 [Testicularia cyperi]
MMLVVLSPFKLLIPTRSHLLRRRAHRAFNAGVWISTIFLPSPVRFLLRFSSSFSFSFLFHCHFNLYFDSFLAPLPRSRFTQQPCGALSMLPYF